MKRSILFNKQNIALAAVCLTALMFGLEISSIPVTLPTLEKVLHGDFSQTQWIMNAYTIACTTVLMATGNLADRFGRKRVYVVSIIAFGITSLLCGLVQNISFLIVGRFLQGLSGGAMLICQIANLSHQFQQGGQRAKAFSVWGIVFGAGLGFGPLIGGLILAVSSWQWVFLIHTPIALVALIFALRGVEESRDPNPKGWDVPGMLLLTLAVFGLTYFITQGPSLGFASPMSIGIIVISTICFILFLLVEKASVNPLFDFSVFRIRNFSGALLGSMGMNFSFWPFIVYFPIYFQSGLGYDAVTTGLSLLAYTLPTLIVPPLAERLSLRYRPGIIIPSGLFTIGLGFFLMKYGSSLSQASWLTLLPGSLLAGIGLGLTNTPVTNTTTGSVSSTRAGMASGIDMSARLITLAINIAIMGFILVKGIFSCLEDAFPHAAGAFPHAADTLPLRTLAEKIAAGNTASPIKGLIALEPATIHTAIVHGFGGMMIYAGIGVWILAGVSFVIFGARSIRRESGEQVKT